MIDLPHRDRRAVRDMRDVRATVAEIARAAVPMPLAPHLSTAHLAVKTGHRAFTAPALALGDRQIVRDFGYGHGSLRTSQITSSTSATAYAIASSESQRTRLIAPP